MAANRFDQLIEAWEGRLKKAFQDAIYNIRDQAQIEQIARMLDRGDVDGALRAVGLDPTQFRLFDKELSAAYEAGGVATAKGLPPLRDADGLLVKFQFNIRNPQAENWLRRYSGNLIREVFDDQRQMIRDVLERGMRAGINPRRVALDLVGRVGANGHRQGGLIGLTASQEKWVHQYAVDLQVDPIKALTRKLRDKRFDATIARHVEREEPLPAELREKLVTTYRNRALRLRAETIARKEAITALHAAQEHAMDQAVASGGVDQSTITYTWRTARDKRVRDTHRSMNGQVRRYGQPFVTGAGAYLDYPGDPSGRAAEVINCRCWREPKIDFLAGIK